jgi:cardiolipin synthase
MEARTEWGSVAIRGAERLARLPFTGANEVELLIDGKATFESIFAGIDAPEDYVLVQFYIVKDDDIGNALKERLIGAAERGVDVYFLYDEIGSLGLPDAYVSELRYHEVSVLPFHSRKGSGNRFQLNFRNHRKTVVVDGHSAWVGGHNVGDEYLSRDEKFGHWRDTHIRISGPAALGAQVAFVEDWQWAADELLGNLSWEPKPSPDANSQALIIASGPADEVETASLMYTQAINIATKRIWIASPYFVPDDAIVQSLQLAAMRGVDVRILIPEVSDNPFVKLAAYSYFDEVSATGVRFYRYQDGFLHQKAMLIDDNVAAVGTANFDNRSFRLNFEITAVIADPEFAAEVEQMFEADFAVSRLMEPDEYDSKSYLFKVAVRIARLAAPVL